MVSRKVRRAYKKLYKKNPGMANLYLLMTELADKDGKVVLNNGPDGTPEQELQDLMKARFNDPEEYAL